MIEMLQVLEVQVVVKGSDYLFLLKSWSLGQHKQEQHVKGDLLESVDK